MADLEDAIIEDELPESIPDMGTGQLPSPAELLKLLDGMDGLSPEDKESLRADLLKSVENGNEYGLPPPSSIFTSQALILFSLLAFISLIFEMAELENLLGKLKDKIDLGPEMQDRIKSMVEKYRDLDDDEKAEFAETVKESFKNSLDKYKANYSMSSFWGISRSYVVLLVAVISFLFIFVFFGYKLYKSLIERERKREEKKKLKELKKKK